MFDHYSYKFKFKILGILFLLLSFMAYKRSFMPLFRVIQEHADLKKKVELNQDESQNLSQLTADINYLDKLIGKEGLGKEKIQQEIIEFISGNEEKVSINHLKSIHQFSDDNYLIYSYQLDLVGDFNKLIKILYNFERTFIYSKVVSANFYTTKQTNKKTTLHLSIIFQNYENHN